MRLRLGSTCTGYGGLDLAVASVLDVEHVWVSDVCKFDKDGNATHHDPCRAPCSILAHRFPGVPNLGDLKSIDWAEVAVASPVDMPTGAQIANAHEPLDLFELLEVEAS